MLENLNKRKDKQLPLPENFFSTKLRHIDGVVCRDYFVVEVNDNLKALESYALSKKYLATILF